MSSSSSPPAAPGLIPSVMLLVELPLVPLVLLPARSVGVHVTALPGSSYQMPSMLTGSGGLVMHLAVLLVVVAVLLLSLLLPGLVLVALVLLPVASVVLPVPLMSLLSVLSSVPLSVLLSMPMTSLRGAVLWELLLLPVMPVPLTPMLRLVLDSRVAFTRALMISVLLLTLPCTQAAMVLFAVLFPSSPAGLLPLDGLMVLLGAGRPMLLLFASDGGLMPLVFVLLTLTVVLPLL